MEKINETVDKIVHMVIGQASRHQAVKDDVSMSLQHAIKDAILADLQPDEESGFSFTEYDALEIYQGPTRLIDLPDEQDPSAAAKAADPATHGEIIVKVRYIPIKMAKN